MTNSMKMGPRRVLEVEMGVNQPIFAISPLKQAFLTSIWPLRPQKSIFMNSSNSLKCLSIQFILYIPGKWAIRGLQNPKHASNNQFQLKKAKKWPFLGFLSPSGPKGKISEKSKTCSNIVSNRLPSIQGGFQWKNII